MIMKRILTILFVLLSVATFGQTYQAMPQAGYGPVKRMRIDSVLSIPIGIPALRNITGGKDTGQIRYVTSDSSIYVFTGTNWVKAGGSGGGPSTPDTIVAKYPIRIDTTGVRDTIYLAQTFLDSVYNGITGFGTGLITAGVVQTDTVINIVPAIIWKRNGTVLTQNVAQPFPITRASTNNFRTDIIYITAADTLGYIQGVQSLSNPSAPVLPLDGILITYVNVFDSVVNTTGPPSTYQRTAVVYVDANTGSLTTDSVSMSWDQTKKTLSLNTPITNADTAFSAVTGRDLRVNNIRIGKGRTYVSNYVFSQAGLANITTGNFNMAFGDSTMRNLTTGSSNVAIGWGSLRNATTNSQNTTLGNATLYNTKPDTVVFVADFTNGSDVINVTSVTSGTIKLNQALTGTGVSPSGGSQWIDEFLTGTGGTGTYRMLRAQTGASATGLTVTGIASAGNNIAIGHNSLFFNGGGYNNTAIGRTAMQSNTVGINNVAVGMSALFNNTTGRENAGVGYWAMLNTTTGRENVAFGTTALRQNTTGSRNVALGREALWTATSKNNNTGVGYRAGYANSGDSCVFLGSEAGNNNTQSNRLYIANTGTATPLIYGEFDSARLTINGRLNITGPLSNTSAPADSALIISTAGQVKKAAIGGGGGGTVTSVGLTTGTSGTDINVGVGTSPVTTSGTITLNIPDAGATSRGVVTTGTQTFAGAKTFSSNLTVSGLDVGSRLGNPVFGGFTLISLTSGSDNTAIGNSAGASLTTGTGNTFLGRTAGGLRTSGIGNTILGAGAYASFGSGSGNENTIVGADNCFRNGNGSRNTSIGFSNLAFCTSGSNNTIIGSVVNLNPTNYTLSNNVIIGDGQGNVRFRNTGSSTYLNGNVGIGNFNMGSLTPTPSSYLLHVEGTAGAVTQYMTGNLFITNGGLGTNTINAQTNIFDAVENRISSGHLTRSASWTQGDIIDLSGNAPINDIQGWCPITLQTGTVTRSSGTANNGMISFRPTYNFTGTYAGETVGIEYRPTLTSLNNTTHIALRATSGQVVIGAVSPDASAAVDITSTTQGFLPPRMTGTQAENIVSPAEGLMVYATSAGTGAITSKGWWGYDGTTWVKLN